MKLWKGRFSKQATLSADKFNSSINTDKRLWLKDIDLSLAHGRMLAKQKIISERDFSLIEKGLLEIKEEVLEGKISFTDEYEDIHMAIETILTEKIGDSGKRLHTARSRNDQVATDLRMYLKDETLEIISLLDSLMEELESIADKNRDTILPGFTHMQKAQPVTLTMHLSAYKEMFLRDRERLEDSIKRTDVMPLGSCALSGTSYNIDRQSVKEELRFRELSKNPMDAVSDRDFVLELLFIISLIMMHLSRFSEEIIIFSTSEFNYIELDDSYSTGSSIMPQKKNPDMAELVRGKTGRVYGNLMAMLTVMKGLPLTYNKDMQEDKELIFDSVDTVKASLEIFKEMIGTATFNKEVMEKDLKTGYMNATDAADYLVKKGVPFRECHEIIGRMVLALSKEGKDIEDLTLPQLKAYSPYFEEDIYEAVDVRNLIKNRKEK